MLKNMQNRIENVFSLGKPRVRQPQTSTDTHIDTDKTQRIYTKSKTAMV